jgi:hypothetical protein
MREMWIKLYIIKIVYLACFCVVLGAFYGLPKQIYSGQDNVVESTTVSLPDSKVLDEFGGDPKLYAALYRYLVSNGRWKVSGVGEIVVARLRDFPTTSENHLAVSIWFGQVRKPAEIAMEEFSSRIGYAGEPESKEIRLWREGRDGATASDVILRSSPKNNAIFVRVQEVGKEKGRVATETALKKIVDELVAVRDHKSEILDVGFVSKIMPPDSIEILKNGPKIECTETEQPGFYTVHGYVNAGEKGYITGHVYDARTSKEIYLETAFERLQYVGWSNDKSQGFKFDFPLMLDGKGKLTNVIIEIEFHPTSSRVLSRTPATLTTGYK